MTVIYYVSIMKCIDKKIQSSNITLEHIHCRVMQGVYSVEKLSLAEYNYLQNKMICRRNWPTAVARGGNT